MGHVIRILGAILAGCVAAYGADITKGYTFSNGEKNITHTKLNNLVDAASINTSFFTDKTASTTPSSSDLLLIYSSGSAAFRKVTLDNLLYSNEGIITSQTRLTSPALGDDLWIYDLSDLSTKKINIGDLIVSNYLSIATHITNATPQVDATFLSLTGTTLAQVHRTNLFYDVFRYGNFTNLAAKVINTNDTMLIWDTLGGTNRQVPMTNLNNYVAATDTNSNPARVRWTTNTVIGGTVYGTNANLSLSGGLSISGTTLSQFGPQAYALFKYAGSSTNITSLRSNNVAWISRDSAGTYRVAFSSALADTNYICNATTDFYTASSTRIADIKTRSTSIVTVYVESPGGTASDPDLVNLIIW